jgi:hypothetical protein
MRLSCIAAQPARKAGGQPLGAQGIEAETPQKAPEALSRSCSE